MALAEHQGELDVRFTRMPFCLRPERVGRHKWMDVLKQLGIDRGNPGWEVGFTRSLAQRGAEVGISFDFERAVVGNSFDSLRLLQWALEGEHGNCDIQNALAERLNHAHFEQGRCVCDEEVMLSCCEEVGLSRAAAKALLDGDGCAATIEAYMHSNRHHSIPVFTFETPYSAFEVDGARGVGEYAALLQMVQKEFQDNEDCADIELSQ